MSAKRRVIPVFIPHLGCPNDCVFCNQNLISGAETAANADTVRKAIADASRVIPPDEPAELAFYGGSFTAIEKEFQTELLKAARPFIDVNPENSIRISTRPDCMDMKTAGRLKAYGVKTVELGAQSMCAEVLCKSKRGHTPQDVSHAALAVKDAGLNLILQMMTGLPGDTREKSVYTAEQFIKLNPDGVRIYPTVIVRGTELYEMWRRGEYTEHTIDDAVTLCAELLVLFRNTKIPVIRLGLNPTDELTSSDAVGGAYHPAFGELVYSRVYLNKVVTQLEKVPAGSEVTIFVSKGRVSAMTGQKRANVIKLTRFFNLKSVRVLEDNIESDEIVVKWR